MTHDLPERDSTRPSYLQGLFRKFEVKRLDGRHQDCTYFVLDVDCDPHARAALKAYIESCRKTHTKLAEDLEQMIQEKEQ